MLDLLGTLIGGATIGAILAAVAVATPLHLSSRLTLGAVFGAWVSLAVAIAASGKLADLPVLLGMFALPLVAVAVLSIASPAVRANLIAIPTAVVIGLNGFRVLGVMFLILASVGRLGGPFPYLAGIGDILTGILAVRVAVLVARGALPNARVIAWNAFGMLDLIVAVTLAVLSRNGSPIQLIHAGAGSAAITSLPWALIPIVLVPLYLIGHVIVFTQVRAHALPASDAQRPQRRARQELSAT